MKSRLKGSFTLQCYRPANLLNLLNSNPEFTQAAWHDLKQRGKEGNREGFAKGMREEM